MANTSNPTMVLSYKIANLAFGAPWLLKSPNHYFAFCSIEGDFKFWIDNKLILQEPSWNIGELAVQLAAWLQLGLQGDFHYQCMDAEEQNLFTFQHQGSSFQFISEWATDSTYRLITEEALTAFISQYRIDVKNRIMNDLGYDSGSYLGK
ncbi:DUF7878 domain-containing protein [Hymenobacter fodinae]|uniref:DUF7878 domain-containing protein n=1 Tax=Hymenobacter fodinae TaxID=2510796 RepID=A0A4Z0P5Q4_9BACT|nr:hypothetical protein [Hymenobacter fodinae]TGE06579.1 hypothetical protein EU556_17255 [Hymenobacter fodinae]